MIEALKSLVGNWFICEPDSENAVLGGEITDYLSSIGISAKNYGKDYLALLSDMQLVPKSSARVIAGSIYMVGRMRNILLSNNISMLWAKCKN